MVDQSASTDYRPLTLDSFFTELGDGAVAACENDEFGEKFAEYGLVKEVMALQFFVGGFHA